MVADVLDTSTGEGAWKPTYCKPLNDWEVEAAQNFLSLLNSLEVNQQEKRSALLEGG